MKETADRFVIDFLSKKLLYRAKQATLKNELLARAIGIKPVEAPNIIDATAGLGRDSFILAKLGYEVTLLERSPELYQLLSQALDQARQELPDIIGRMHLIEADAILWLPKLAAPEKPDVIYLDPMFPERKKSASVKKEMVFMQELLGKCDDHAELFEVAMQAATKRVVVKRPRLAPNIVEKEPNFCYRGKSSRFDVYLVKR